MTEERKHAILFAATLLSARRLIGIIEGDKPKMNEQYFIDSATDKVCFVMEKIDHKLASKTGMGSTGPDLSSFATCQAVTVRRLR